LQKTKETKTQIEGTKQKLNVLSPWQFVCEQRSGAAAGLFTQIHHHVPPPPPPVGIMGKSAAAVRPAQTKAKEGHLQISYRTTKREDARKC
jgi:hypothetical protein